MRVAAAVSIFAVLSIAVACRPGGSSWEIRPDHVGAVRFGMPAADARRALGDTSITVPATGCAYWHTASMPSGVSLMIENGVVARADVDSAGPQTAEGVGVGSTEAAIRTAYGEHVTVQLHKYQWEAGWRYFIYLPPQDSSNAIVFETDGSHVRSYRVGRRPQVQYAERCG